MSDQVLRRRSRRRTRVAVPTMLESPFVLWLLSAAFISFGSWAYSGWDASRKEQKALEDRIARLDGEIQFRFARSGIFVKFRTLNSGELNRRCKSSIDARWPISRTDC